MLENQQQKAEPDEFIPSCTEMEMKERPRLASVDYKDPSLSDVRLLKFS